MKKIGIVLILTLLLGQWQGDLYVQAEATPMLFQHTTWKYGTKGERLHGFIPALDTKAERPWELARWTAIFHFPDHNKTTMANYDVFNIKKKLEDDDFDRENGFGLIYRSEAALGEWFDQVFTPQLKTKLAPKQWDHFRTKFIQSAKDPIFIKGHENLYHVEKEEFFRTTGIAQRVGAKFERVEKKSEDDRTAHFTVTDFPSLSVKRMGTKYKCMYSAHGFTNRTIRLLAVPHGKWLGEGKEAKITAITTDLDGTYTPEKMIEMEQKQITKMLGVAEQTPLDFILDDGYGRTAVVKNPKQTRGNIDFVPTTFTLTDNGQLWMILKYHGSNAIKRDEVVEKEGMPIKTTIRIQAGKQPAKTFTTPFLYTKLPATLQPNTPYRLPLGKVNLEKKPGTYTIEATAIINDPNHPKRALEAPDSAYRNNEIKQKWVREIKINDLMAIDIKLNPSTVTEKKKTYIKARVKNRGLTLEKNVEIAYFANGKKIKSIRKDLPANRTITLPSVAYQPQTRGVQAIRVEVDPNREKADHDRTNNSATTGCTITTDNSKRSSLYCGWRPPGKKESWTVTYDVLMDYDWVLDQREYCYSSTVVASTDRSEIGNSEWNCEIRDYYVYDWSSPYYEKQDVTYNESLKIDAKINTKQGIPTDPDHPKESDQESRGSWEIIDYAKKQGIDPNTVTRAGYGVELKVTTTYETDWETKVPYDADPIGRKYEGVPQDVTAYIINQKDRRVVDEIQLEKTSDNGKKATWEFPVVKYQNSITGKTYRYRKYYTDKDWADGKRSIYIQTSGVGATQINQCKTVDFTIYGSMYDDIQNLQSFPSDL